MTKEEAIAYFTKCNEDIISVCKDENVYNYEKQEIEAVYPRRTFEANCMAISALKGGWIPTEERLPKMGEVVMCCNKHGSVFTSAITHRGICEKPYFGSHYNVVAWQPLPEPYKKGGE